MINYLLTLSCERTSNRQELIRTISTVFLKAKAEPIPKQRTKMIRSTVMHSKIWITVSCIKHPAMVDSINSSSLETKTLQVTTTKSHLTSDSVIKTH